MGLFQRITASGPTKISVHEFWAATNELARGKLNPQQVIDAFNLTGDEVTDFNALVAAYNALGTGTGAAAFAKSQYLDAVHGVFVLCETGKYNEAAAKASLGF